MNNPNTGFLVLVRHGFTEYNLKNVFTGHLDPDISKEDSIPLLKEAGTIIKDYQFTLGVSSTLKRTQTTLDYLLDVVKQTEVLKISTECLNERSYGILTGRKAKQAKDEFGSSQIKAWRRGTTEAPPGGESLATVADGVDAYFQENILGKLMDGDNVLLISHENVLRALILRLLKMSPDQIEKTEIGWCEPVIIKFDKLGKIANVNIKKLPSFHQYTHIPFSDKEGNTLELKKSGFLG